MWIQGWGSLRQKSRTSSSMQPIFAWWMPMPLLRIASRFEFECSALTFLTPANSQKSTSAERAESGAWIVHGQLALHGQTRSIVTTITEDQGHYRGAMTLRQTDYGITPISVAGGAVKVKDELKIDFDIVMKGNATP
jgi:hypothetical protein